MNADELYEHLCNGATLTTRWKRRHMSLTKPRLIHKLQLSDKTIVAVQRSTIDGLWRDGLIRRIYWQAGECDYEVIK